MRRRSYLVACLIIHASARAPKFEPYANNHGSAAAAAGADFVYLASDAQHVAGMTIASCQARQRGLTPCCCSLLCQRDQQCKRISKDAKL